MTPKEKLETYDLVCQAVDKRPGESIVNASRRAVMRYPSHTLEKRVGNVILSQGIEDPWERMRFAADEARRGRSSDGTKEGP